jgi:DUF1009 family protein
LKLGLIAGAGLLPVVLAQEAKYAGKQVLVISITKSVDEQLVSLSHPEFYQIGPGQVKKILNTLLKMDAQEVVIIGRVSRDILFKPLHLDIKAIKILSKLKNKNDTSIFKGIADEMESVGLNLIDQRLYLSKLLPQKGILTKREPTKSEWKDIEYGMDLARKIAQLGIGQTVIVKGQAPLAIEAVEGTDEAIRRGGKLSYKHGAVATKASSPDHDFRFDVPTIGPDTIDVIAESGLSVLAIELGKAFLLESEETIRKADKNRISLVVI